MIQVLENQAKVIAAKRNPCDCPRGLYKGVKPDLVKWLMALEAQLKGLEASSCECPSKGAGAGLAGQLSALEELENRVSALEAANKPCHCPFNHIRLMELPPEVRFLVWEAVMGDVANFYPTAVAASENPPAELVKTSNRSYTSDVGEAENIGLLQSGAHVYQEVAVIFYRRLFRFHGNRAVYGHPGMVAATEFLTDHAAGANSLMRSLWVDTTNSQTDRENLFDQPGPMAQMVAMMQRIGQMANLRHLSLELNGEAPDLRQPAPAPPGGLSVWWTPAMTATWLTPMLGDRRINRVTLRIRFNLPKLRVDGWPTWVEIYPPELVARFVHFIATVRNGMLREGDRLGTGLVHARLRHLQSRDEDL